MLAVFDMIDYDQKQECVQVPLELFEKMKKSATVIQSDFTNISKEWSTFFDEQLDDN